MSLQNIELELLRTLPSLNLRPTLAAAQTAGKLLDQARDLVPHGGWLQFLSRIGLTQRTAHDYVTVYRHAGDQRPAAAPLPLWRSSLPGMCGGGSHPRVGTNLTTPMIFASHP